MHKFTTQKVKLNEPIVIALSKEQKAQISRINNLNKKWSKELGWNPFLIETLVFGVNSCLTKDEFVNNVIKWQRKNSFWGNEVDGIIGRKTYAAMLKNKPNYLKKQFDFLKKDLENEYHSLPKNAKIDAALVVIGYVKYANGLVKELTNKSIQKRMYQDIAEFYRLRYKALSSMKVLRPISKGLNFISEVSLLLETQYLIDDWMKVLNKKDEVNAKIVMDTYLYVLSNLGELFPAAKRLSVAASGVSLIFQFSDSQFKVYEKLDFVSDVIAYEWSTLLHPDNKIYFKADNDKAIRYDGSNFKSMYHIQMEENRKQGKLIRY